MPQDQPERHETRYTYNIYNDITDRKAKNPADSTGLSGHYEYTPEGLLKSAIAQGMRYDYTYDVADRLSAKTASGRALLTFAYDRNGNLIHQKDITGKETEYRYDLNDRISETWDNGKLLAQYGYNANGMLKALCCAGVYMEYDYDTDRNMSTRR